MVEATEKHPATEAEVPPFRRTLGIKIGLTLFLLLGALIALWAVMMKADNLSQTDMPRARAGADIVNLERMVRQYARVTGDIPDQGIGLQALVEARMITELPTDPWGTAYRYEIIEGRGRIISYGADGQPGGEGEARDVYHPDLQR
ncbi:MAG TPA: type II secretion system protein GspG [Myxococcaceae bacterium]|nr:type II secretion system protein GspG [Myxococcaceae bacterium]